jgi:hypothetical protein
VFRKLNVLALFLVPLLLGTRNEALDKSSCILLGKGAAWPETIEFEAAVPSLDFTVALRVIRGGSDMGQSGQTVKSAFYARALLSTKSCEQFQDG